MRIKTYILLVVASVAMILTGCHKEEFDTLLSDKEVGFNSGIKIQTKASGSKWSDGDNVGIRMINSSNSAVAGYVNQHYVANSDGALTPFGNNTIYYPIGENVGFMAYYPYNAALSGNEYIADVSNQTSLENIDFLWAKTAGAIYNRESSLVDLTFTHELSKIVINTIPGKDITDLTNLSVEIKGISTKNSFDLINGTWGVSYSPSTILPHRISASNYQAIVLPEAIANGSVAIDFKLGEKSYTWNFPATTFVSEMMYTWNVTIHDTEITVSAVTISPWAEVSTSDKIGEARVGDLLNGGVVYWVNPLDVKDYKIVALDEPVDGSDLNATLSSATLITYILGAGDARDENDGRKNIAAMQSYSLANLLTFDVSFPAAAWCYNYTAKGKDSKGTWYLPSYRELETLAKVWDNASGVVKNAIASNGGVAFKTANYWSATEAGVIPVTNYALAFTPSNISTITNITKISRAHVRCIRR